MNDLLDGLPERDAAAIREVLESHRVRREELVAPQDPTKPDRDPRPRRRFAARARTLRGQRDFRAALAVMRAEWDVRYPDLSIGSLMPWPERPNRVTTLTSPRLGSFVIPPRALAAWEKLGADAWAPIADWLSRIHTGCSRWWPSEYFPNYLGKPRHPALLFLSSCMIFDERDVPGELMADYHYEPSWHPFDPTDENAHPTIRGLVAQVSALTYALIEALGDDEPRIVAAIEKGHAARAEAKADAQAEQVRPGRFPEVGFWYVPLTPELNTTDWDQLKPLAIERVRQVYGDDPVRDHIVRLRAEGRSQVATAELLGVTERFVQQVEAERRAGRSPKDEP